MKFLYLVSPDFLRTIIKESMNYSFAIKGYYSVEEGLDNLLYSNVEDLCGFALVFYELPQDLTPLVKLINEINLIAKDKSVVLCTMMKEGLDVLNKYIQIDNVNFFLLSDFDSMTDVIIRRSILGTIVSETEPSYLEDYVSKKLERGTPSKSSWSVILNEKVLSLSEDVINAPDIHRAISHDPIAKKWQDVDDMFYFLRKAQIKKKYNDTSNSDADDNLFEGLLKFTKDFEESLICKSLYSLIKEGNL